MESRAPAVVAVVVTTGPGPGLEATVASLEAQDYAELSLLVVANGESEHVASRVAAVAPTAFVRVLDENRGFAVACNEASLMVDGSAFFLFCHDDVRLESDVVQIMVEAAFRMNAGVVTPKYVSYDDPLVLLHVGQACDRFGVVQERIEEGEIDHGQQDLERDVFVAPGGVTLVRSDLFVTLRGFDPLIPVLGEDLDLCWRAQVAGARIVVAPAARVAHGESIAANERAVTALGVRRASRQDLQRRHQLLVVATGWRRRSSLATMSLLMVMDLMEFLLSLLGRDADRAGAIVGSWRWLFKNRKHIRARRRQSDVSRVLSDVELRRLQIGGASRLKRFFLTLVRHGLDRARGILPPLTHEPATEERVGAGVGFASAFAEMEELDDIPTKRVRHRRRNPAQLLSSFRSQAAVVAGVTVLWLLGSRNLVAMHLPLVGRLAPLDSWWSTWRHFFASWSPNGVGTGTPDMPGYGVLGVAGTFVFGRMGILPRLVLIAAVPTGAVGVVRLLQGRVSNRARVVAGLAYLVFPLGLNMISQGRVDVLVVVAVLPLVVRRIFELLAVPGFRTGPYPTAVGFAQPGWRASAAGQRMVLVLLSALLTALVPAALVLVVLIVASAAAAQLFEGNRVSSTPWWRLLGTVVAGVALLLLPLTIDTMAAGSRALEVFGLARGPWSAPSFFELLRGADGSFGLSWWGWLLPLGAALSLGLCRGERRSMAMTAATTATATVILATGAARHWMGPFSPDLDVLLTLYMVMLVFLIGLGVSALELDIRQAGFGWRQVSAALLVAALFVSSIPFLASLVSGRFDLPTTSVAQSLSALAPTRQGGYRVLWLGDPSVLPTPGWSVVPGLELATSMNGSIGGTTLFSPPDPGASDVLISAVHLALESRTVHLGQLLARAGVSTIVVMNTSAPEISGVANAPYRAVPATLFAALARQTDLALVLQTSAVDIFSNAKFYGLVSQSTSSSPPQPILANLFLRGIVRSSATVSAALAPASAFALNVNGSPAPRSVSFGWAPTFKVGSYHEAAYGQLVVRQFPWNGLVALMALLLWAAAGYGFTGRRRLRWFGGRRANAEVGRHAAGAQ